MAELNLYKCKRCGWSIEAASEGNGIYGEGILAYFICHDCKLVYEQAFSFGTVFNKKLSCPNCGGKNTDNWEPIKLCPKCGGELENQGVTCLMD